jgi:glyoxylase-like metal-dependent hydrolase (beta-lactamase superfamily II)
MPMMKEPVKPLRVVRLLVWAALLAAAGMAVPPGRGGHLAAFDGRSVVADGTAPGLALAQTSPYRVAARQNQTAGQRQNGAGASVEAAADVKSLHVQGNVWMLIGGGVNAAVQIGDEGVLVVDTMTEPLADKMLAEIRRLAGDKPIRYVINTHVHPDHTGGNEKIAGAGQSIVAGNFAGQVGQDAANLAAVLAHENVLNRMSAPVGSQAPRPFKSWPTDTFFVDDKDIYFNGEGVELVHVPAAHTDGDVMVWFRKSDVVVAGDLFITTTFPVVDLPLGGNLKGIIAGLNRIIDITIPRDRQEGGTYVIPGHGRLTDEADVVDYRDMVTIIRDRFQDAIKKGMTLEQVKAARLLRDYEGRYGAASGSWTTDGFIEAAYKSLSQAAPTSATSKPAAAGRGGRR